MKTKNNFYSIQNSIAGNEERIFSLNNIKLNCENSKKVGKSATQAILPGYSCLVLRFILKIMKYWGSQLARPYCLGKYAPFGYALFPGFQPFRSSICNLKS